MRFALATPLGIVALVMLASCAAQGCDPTQTDLFSGIGCSAGGGYATRTQGLQAQFSAASSNAQGQTLAAREAQHEAAVAQDNLNRRRDELGALDAETHRLRIRLELARRNHQVSEGRLRDAEAKLAAVSKQRESTSDESSEAQIDALKVRQKNLSEILSEM